MTIEEIEQEVSANPDLLKGVVGLVSQKGFVVRSQDEEKSYIENYDKNVIPQKVSAAIGSRVEEIATRYEQDLIELTGMQKEQGEKYFNFQKRVFSTLQNKDGEANKNLVDQINLYKEKVSQLETGLKQEQEGRKNEILTFKNQTLLDSALQGINLAIPSHLSTDEEKLQYKKTFENMVRNDFERNFKPKDIDGNIAYYQGDDLLFDTTTAKHLTPSDIIKKNYGTFIAPETTTPKGMGLGTNPQAPKVGKMTKDEYFKYADDKGMITGSKEWYSEYTALVAAE